LCRADAERRTLVPNLRQLEYLVAIADTLNFRRAAERTNSTQPTLSEQLKALEERLGAQLVERGRSGVLITPIGAQVVEIARRMLRDAHEIRTLSTSGGKELSGLLRLGLPPTVGPYLLARIVPELHRNYPGLKLYIREEMPNVLPRALSDGTLDVIMTFLPLPEAELKSIPLFREPLYLAVAADHPLAQRAQVERVDLEGQDVLTLGPGHQLHDTVVALCEEFGAHLRHDFEGTSLDTLREMVVMGLGVTFLPGLYVRREIENDPSLKALELHGRSIYRTVGMVWRKSSARQETYERLAEFFRAAIAREFSDMIKM
jgi:LysR family transcriptional regulator, hydrogen peroxide-inducible genes activator